ncbi:MAG: hypothetical protein HY231_25400 [Acidobacteria bacterium]|nr:hypothetical protein [Acidobacteriota bacterium]
MENVLLTNIVEGGLLIALGMVFIFFHEHMKKIDDSINSRLLGRIWISSYSHEALLLMKATYTVAGVSLVLLGAGVIVNSLR